MAFVPTPNQIHAKVIYQVSDSKNTKNLRNLFILDWDNTLFATDYMQKVGIINNSSFHYPENHNHSLYNQLIEVEEV